MLLLTRARLFAVALAALLVPGLAAAQAVGVVRGEVTDASGGVLPGVSVTAMAADNRVVTGTVTDNVGRFEFRGLPAGRVTLTFQLDGFDTERVQLLLHPPGEAQVTARLRLAQITEQVVVVGKLPEDPPPPPPPAVPYRRPVPTVVPVPVEQMQSICVPAKAAAASTATARIHSHRHDAGRSIFTKGDELFIDGGTAAGLTVGRNMVARRTYRTSHSGFADALGEHTSGLVQIVSADEHTATAVILHACYEVLQGDYLAAFVPEPVRAAQPAGAPDFDDAIAILFGESGQLFGVQGRLMVIDRGSKEGIAAGQRLTIFRRDRKSPRPYVLGDALVVSARSESATIRIERTTDVVTFGDWVAPQLPAPLARSLVTRSPQ